jgi:hypothetical protein
MIQAVFGLNASLIVSGIVNARIDEWQNDVALLRDRQMRKVCVTIDA